MEKKTDMNKKTVHFEHVEYTTNFVQANRTCCVSNFIIPIRQWRAQDKLKSYLGNFI
jgi:hypothetical protein